VIRVLFAGLVAVASISGGSGGGRAHAETPPPPIHPLAEACRVASPESVFVETIVASDEVLLSDGRRVRLAGVEPARAPLGPGAADTARAAARLEAAGRRLLDRLSEAEELAFHDFGEDRHGRRVGHLVATGSGQDIASALVAAGLLRVAHLGAPATCTRARLSLEAEARAARAGLWGDPRLGLRRANDPSLVEMVGASVVVEGRVKSVGHSGARTWLNFGDDFRRDFAVALDDKTREALAGRGIAADGLRGRGLRVRGILVLREGLRIEPATADDVEQVTR
jgi:endonuclease YncB( thermonuclease family)